MLVLTRKIGEQVILPGSDVRIEVLGVTGKRVRLGFVAPPDIPVHRLEVWQRTLPACLEKSRKRPAEQVVRDLPVS